MPVQCGLQNPQLLFVRLCIRISLLAHFGESSSNLVIKL